MNLTADNRDKYRLYTLAFQQPHTDIGFSDDLFRQRNGRVPRLLREDYCGTAIVTCEWIGVADDRFANGVDIDPEPLTWCRTHLLSALLQQYRDRIDLIHADVVSAPFVAVDIILALNASFCAFKHRKQLLDYFRSCYGTLEPDGVLILGLYAGPEAQMVGADEIQCDGFVAIWEQSSFNAVTNEAVNRIHFTFPEGYSIIDASRPTLPEPADLTAQSGRAAFGNNEPQRSESFWKRT